MITLQNPKAVLALLAASAPLVKKPVVPVLASVLLTAADGVCTLTVTDLGLVMREQVDATAQVGAVSSMLIPHDVFTQAARAAALAGVPLSVATEGKQVVLTAGRTRLSAFTMDVDEYPYLQFPPGEGLFTVQAGALGAALRLVVPLVDDTGSRGVCGNLSLEYAEGALTLAGSEGHQLAVHTVPAGCTRTGALFIPQHTAAALVRALPAEGVLTFAHTNNGNVVATCEARTFVINLSRDTQYVNYRQFIPHTTERFSFAAGDFLAAIKILGRDTGHPLTLENDGEGTLTLSRHDETVVSTTVAISADHAPHRVCFNQTYLRDFLSLLPRKAMLSFTQKDDKAGALFTSPQVPGFLYVIMPVREMDHGRGSARSQGAA